METSEFRKIMGSLGLLSLLLLGLMLAVMAFTLVLLYQPESFQAGPEKESTPEFISEAPGLIEDGIHVETGLVDGEGLVAVINNCTNCHSTKLVTQNRFTAEGWTGVIRWMQETQDLWDLGANEEIIVSYLARHYAPEATGRRKPLEVEEWYELE